MFLRHVEGCSARVLSASSSLTATLVVLTCASLAAESIGHDFSYWSFLTLLVICRLVAFCLILDVPVRIAVGRR